MKAVWIAIFVCGVGTLAENSAHASHCGWIKRREFIRYEVEKTARERFSRQINRKLQEYLDTLSADERAEIKAYGSEGADQTRTLIELRRRLDIVAKDFNTARCTKGNPLYDNGYPSKDLCIEDDESMENAGPNFYRGLRLYADQHTIFIEGEIRQASRKKLIRPRGDFPAGEYFVRVYLGAPDEERRQIKSAAAEFNFNDFEDFLDGDEKMPVDCVEPHEVQE